MSWGKESHDNLRALAVHLEKIVDLGADILHLSTADQDLKFWEDAAIAALSGLLSNDSEMLVFRPDLIAEKAAHAASSLLEHRNEFIAQRQKSDPETSS